MNPRPATVTAAPAPPAQVDADSLAPPFGAQLARAVERAWAKAAVPPEWNLSLGQFQSALERSAAKRFAGAPAEPRKIEAYLDALHARDLALAVACASGNSAAWDFFMKEFRPELYRAARAIVGYAPGRDVAARHLADSLYADLYGLRESRGRRKSLFDYFHGRSKLSTWIHAVLAQRHVDEIRRARAAEPLEDASGEVSPEVEMAAPPAAGAGAPAHRASPGDDPERAIYLAALQAALSAALAALQPRDRLRLAYYYADERTLAEIGRLLGEHEATVSRKLDRTRRDLRSQVENWLADAKKWTGAQVAACLECAAGEWPFDLIGRLKAGSATQASQAPAEPASHPAARKI